MARRLEILALQAAPLALPVDVAAFAHQARAAMAAFPGADLLVFPELHMFDATDDTLAARNDALRAAAVQLGADAGHALDAALCALAHDLNVCLIPGTLCEAGPQGKLHNTARVYGPDGAVLASYRKIFPWRPSEPYDPGERFVVFDLPGKGRIGLTICYDAWFPEVTRQVAWMGAELVVNLVKTTTPDRAQEVVLARANAIVNQTFLLSLNCAGPTGMGDSLLVDPEGEVLMACPGTDPGVIHAVIDLENVNAVRERGTCGENRLWHHFVPGDRPINLPAYGGALDPTRWTPPGWPVASQDESARS